MLSLLQRKRVLGNVTVETLDIASYIVSLGRATEVGVDFLNHWHAIASWPILSGYVYRYTNTAACNLTCYCLSVLIVLVELWTAMLTIIPGCAHSEMPRHQISVPGQLCDDFFPRSHEEYT